VPQPTEPERVTLRVTGMTCTSCAARIERSLDKLPGVTADVNFATGRAEVRFDPTELDLAEILRAVRRTGYDASPALDDAARHTRFSWGWIGVAGAVALASMLVPASESMRIGEAVATAAVLATAGRPFFEASWAAARHRSVSMDTLVALGAGLAYVYSLAVTLLARRGLPTYFDAASMIVAVIGLGKLVEERWTSRARQGLDALEALAARTLARRDEAGELAEVPLVELESGDIVLLRAGDVVPGRAEVRAGAAWADGAMRTGRSEPRWVVAGDALEGGEAISGGSLEVRLLEPARLGLVVELARLVGVAQHRRARLATLADAVSARFVPTVIAIAAADLVVRLVVGETLATAIASAVAVVVVACPCAMGLATPIAFLVASTRAAARGIILNHPDALEAARNIDVVLLDRTGTLTEGKLAASWPAELDERDRALIASLTALSQHPVSRALAAGTSTLLGVEDVTEVPGAGITGHVDGHAVRIGNAAFVGATPPFKDGRWVYARVDDRAPIAVELTEHLRERASWAVSRLVASGVRVELATGDERPELAEEAARLGIARAHLGLGPAEKVALVETLRRQGHRVAMVGDGTNDAAALASADLGIALGAGTHLAQANADVVLLGDDLDAMADVLELARRTVRTIRENLGWALGYNVLAIPAALFGVLSPMLAAALMASSSLIVVANALRIRLTAPTGGEREVEETIEVR
jgi:Cu+-exporting ATPase